MLKIFTALVFILIITTLSIQVCAQNKNKEPNVSIVKIQTSAHTDMCKNKIEKTLAYEKGVIKSELNQESQILTVKYKSNKTNAKKIIAVIESLGHSALEIPEDDKETKD